MNYFDEISRLQQKLGEVKEAGDTDAEIDTLLLIGEAALEEAPQLAYSHFKLAERVILGTKKLVRLHEAIGGQGRAFRRNRRFGEAIERYQAAEQAAKKEHNRAAQANWILRHVSAQRSLGNLEKAKTLVQQAERLLRLPPGEKVSYAQFMGLVNFANKEEVAVLAELDGQIGMNLIAEDNKQESEDYYRSALYFAEMAEDRDAINTWATNVGNALLRRGRYSQAMEYYEKALAATEKQVSRSSTLKTAECMADCMANAYRHEEGGDRLRVLAAAEVDEHCKVSLLTEALKLYDEGSCTQKAIDTVQQIESLIAGQSVNPEFIDRIKSIRKRMEKLDNIPAAPDNAPTMLEEYLVRKMALAEESEQIYHALQAAHLVCDVRLALALAGGDEWKRLLGGDILRNPGLDLRAIFDTLRMLIEAGRNDDALELIQRYKAPTFCIPTLLRLQNSDNPGMEVRAYLDAIQELCEQVNKLSGPSKQDSMRIINAVRCAGERLREAGEVLRDIDPMLLARMGGPVRSDDLIDALPFGGGVGIVDFIIGPEATLSLALGRGLGSVFILPFISPTFNATHSDELFKLFAEGNIPKQLGGRQTEALMKIAKILHDNYFCKLTQELSKHGINQLILIPDVLMRHFPLHLARVCGKEFDIPDIDTKDAQFLCEVMPVEYAPCLQAVAASQAYLRPKAINRITAFVDPNGDLPGVRASVKEFILKSGIPEAFKLKPGKTATKAAVSDALSDSDILIFGTHGVFSPGNLEQTHLVLSDEPWTMADMLYMPDLKKRALLLLIACEAGAIAATPDDRDAWGIPGALVSAGASAVMANLWPVEDVTSNYLLEHFLLHLGHKGYRPAAAFFRSVRDLRRMKRDEAIEHCRQYMEKLKENKAPPRVLKGARTILEFVEDHDSLNPFAHPFFWGATVIFGSGWHLPAGAFVGEVEDMIKIYQKGKEADELLMKGQLLKAQEIATQVADTTDGVLRGNAYTTIALALLWASDISSQVRIKRKATRYLKAAQRIAINEEDEKLQNRVQWALKQMEDKNVA